MKKIILIILLLNAYSGFANSERDKSSNTEALNTFQKQHIYALNKRIDEIKDNEIREQLRLEIEKTADKKNCYCLNPQSSDFEDCVKIEDQKGEATNLIGMINNKPTNEIQIADSEKTETKFGRIDAPIIPHEKDKNIVNDPKELVKHSSDGNFRSNNKISKKV